MASAITNILQTLRLTPAPATNRKAPVPPKSFPQAATDVLHRVLPEISLSVVAQHDDYSDCWIVIYDRVYDVTNFLREHPGGEDVIMEHAGRDATLAFHGTGHSGDAIAQMADYLIGELPAKERIFRNEHSSVLLSGIPQ